MSVSWLDQRSPKLGWTRLRCFLQKRKLVEDVSALMKTGRKPKPRLEPSCWLRSPLAASAFFTCPDSRPEVVVKFFLHLLFNCGDFGISVFLQVKPRPLRW